MELLGIDGHKRHDAEHNKCDRFAAKEFFLYETS